MKKIFYLLVYTTTIGIFFGCIFNHPGEVSDSEIIGQFAIFLPAEESMIDDTSSLSQIPLSKEPILSVNDVISYHAETHEFNITASAVERMNQLDPAGRFFIVTVGNRPIYFGRFMAAYFSMSYDGVVILWPPMNDKEENLQIQLGYPGPDIFEGIDPRADPRIFESLRQADKLR